MTLAVLYNEDIAEHSTSKVLPHVCMNASIYSDGHKGGMLIQLGQTLIES
jgi:hypothetical protein